MVKNLLPFRSSKGDNVSSKDSDASSVTSSFSQWTAVSTAQTVSDASAELDVEPLALSLHPFADQGGMIVKIAPPTTPAKPIAHVPCDVVLVIDISGSMGASAPIPTNPSETAEDYGLTVLDLVKHAARTILSTMDASDRLGIVTFASSAKVLQKLTPMDTAGKVQAEKKISSMDPVDSTNLWHGILEGIKLFKEGGEVNSGRVPAIMILTDGEPNYMCPPQGYVPKLRNMEKLPASLHTFGFGYSLRSGLLKSIAEVGLGNYAFIPDAGMIGTVFVHAMANLQTTFAINATLRLTYPAVLDLQETTGNSIDQQEIVTLLDEPGEPKQLSILLGNLQYGQSRDIYLKLKAHKRVSPERSNILATLEYSRMTSPVFREQISQGINTPTMLSESEIAYHISRSKICMFLSSLLSITDNGEYFAASKVNHGILANLQNLITTIPAQKFPGDVKNKSLLEDLSGELPKGQISLALTTPEYYTKWGVHYLPSLLNAHKRQMCNTFKDPGPLQYGTESPLFISCRNNLDAAFDNLPAPKPSRRTSTTKQGSLHMRHYNSSSGVCFAGSTSVSLASGRKIPISAVRKGTELQTPNGTRHVSAVLKTPVIREKMCRIGDLVVTPWHPISLDQGKTWIFPADVANKGVSYSGNIYSILLEPDSQSDSHAISISGGILGVTLGHGLLAGPDVRSHAFFGNYDKVARSLREIGVKRWNGIAVGGGVNRDSETGLVTGFKRGKKVVRTRNRRLLAFVEPTRGVSAITARRLLI